MVKGSLVALVTPMQADGSVDFAALASLVDWHLSAGTHALVVNGTTGESATLSDDEQAEVLMQVVAQVAKKIPVIAGTGTNCTRTTVLRTERAKNLGADACLVVTPYYNKPTQQGLVEHYWLVAERSAVPIILYNVPSRTACDLLPETVAKLAKHPRIVGLKEATGQLSRLMELQALLPPDFFLWSGDDATAMEFMLKGGQGVISVTANVAPKMMRNMCEAALMDNVQEAEQINARLIRLHHDLFIESNPIPVKWALAKMGRIAPFVRLPLTILSDTHHTRLTEAIEGTE